MHKVTKKIKNIGLLLLSLGIWIHPALGQEKYNLNGSFEGEHIEFTSDVSNDSIVYLYKFDLEQDEDRIVGKSTIYTDQGYYAVVALRGVIVEDQFYFEEYETIDEINPTLNHWCYTSGHLEIIKEDESIRLEGYTKSHTKQYGAFCRAGYSNVSKPIDEESNEYQLAPENAEIVEGIYLNPNPTQTESSINFTLRKDALTIVEIRDLEGELILEAVNRRLLPGEHSFLIDLAFEPEGMYIVELIVNRELYTRELWKGKL